MFVYTSTIAQTLEEFYFNSNFNSSGGGAPLSEVLSCTAANGAFGQDSVITSEGFCSNSTVFCFNEGGGLRYQNTSITGQYSINLFFKFNYLSSWARIIDFSNGNTDSGFYLLSDCLNFFPNGNVGTCPFFKPDVYYLITFVRDGISNVISVYVNGTRFGTYIDSGNIYKPANPNIPIFFFRDDVAVACEDKPGCIKYASVTADTLSAAQVDSIWQNICTIAVNECDTSMPVADFTYATGQSEYEILFNSSSEHIQYYFWDFGDGDTSTLSNPSHIFPFDGSWPVTLVVSNTCGNDTISQNVQVIKSALNELTGLGRLTVYPNPATDMIGVTGVASAPQHLTIQIYNLQGQLLQSRNSFVSGTFKEEVQVGKMAGGSYFLVLSNAHSTKTIRWVKL